MEAAAKKRQRAPMAEVMMGAARISTSDFLVVNCPDLRV
jgi:hypothetical protein